MRWSKNIFEKNSFFPCMVYWKMIWAWKRWTSVIRLFRLMLPLRKSKQKPLLSSNLLLINFRRYRNNDELILEGLLILEKQLWHYNMIGIEILSLNWYSQIYTSYCQSISLDFIAIVFVCSWKTYPCRVMGLHVSIVVRNCQFETWLSSCLDINHRYSSRIYQMRKTNKHKWFRS